MAICMDVLVQRDPNSIAAKGPGQTHVLIVFPVFPIHPGIPEYRYNQAEMVEWLASHGAPTSVLTAHNRRPFDMTRPGKTRCTLYQAMLDDTKK